MRKICGGGSRILGILVFVCRGKLRIEGVMIGIIVLYLDFGVFFFEEGGNVI